MGDVPYYVARIIDALLRRGFSHGEIAALTLHGAKNPIFSERGRVGNFTLRRFTSKYDLFGKQILTPGQITFDSVRRFKGQQAPALFLIDVEPDHLRPGLSQWLLYTGMTRATVRVELLLPSQYSTRYLNPPLTMPS